MTPERLLREVLGLEVLAIERLDVAVNDVLAVETTSGRFALKCYNAASRGPHEAAWEVDLVEHLAARGAPVVRPIRARSGDAVHAVDLDGEDRAAVLWTWAPGEKPRPSRATYLALGGAAARIHAAADSFAPSWTRDDYDAAVLIDEQIARMQRHLEAIGRLDEVVALGARLQERLADPGLDRGVCHMDLTLDNVHHGRDGLVVFDFDSAGRCWRAMEPYGVLRFSRAFFADWLEGYRTVRPFSRADERAVSTFAIVGDLRNTTWKLGEAVSSRGAPLLTADDLPAVVDGWLAWEREQL